MSGSFMERVEAIARPSVIGKLDQCLQAVEREGVRVDAQGHLASTPHPVGLGSPLTHSSVVTDFSEVQLEFVSPTFKGGRALCHFLRQLQSHVLGHLDKECIWPFSTPCMLPAEEQIPIAQFGDSDLGQQKHLYRLGLSERYGRRMQMLSGIHYNFSLDLGVWEQLTDIWGPASKKTRSEAYLGLARNFLRHSWLNTYLFGATPAAHESFFPEKLEGLERGSNGTCFLPQGTSLRMSRIGYYGRCQRELRIGYNSLPSYLDDLKEALREVHPDFSNISRQLNNHVLQLEAEHYSEIRPKPPLASGLRPVEALQKEGIVYVEVRSVDVNPFAVEGVDTDQLQFLHLFMLLNLLLPSPPMEAQEWAEQRENQNRVAVRGRAPGLCLLRSGAEVDMQEWAEELLEQMQAVAELLDLPREDCIFGRNVERQRQRLRYPDQTLSGRIVRELAAHNWDFLEYGLLLAKQYRTQLLSEPLDPAFVQQMSAEAARSLLKEAELPRGPQLISV